MSTCKVSLAAKDGMRMYKDSSQVYYTRMAVCLIDLRPRQLQLYTAGPRTFCKYLLVFLMSIASHTVLAKSDHQIHSLIHKKENHNL